MALYLYGVTSSEIGSTYLAGSGDVDSTVLDHFIEEAAAKLNSAIMDAGVDDPSAITLADYPNDYTLVRSALMNGAAAKYLQAVGGSNTSVNDKLGEYRDTVAMLRTRPNVLTIVQAIDSRNIPRSHTTNMSTSKFQKLRNRLGDPSRKRQWETL